MGLNFRESKVKKLLREHRARMSDTANDVVYGPMAEEEEFSDEDREKKPAGDFVFPDRKAWPFKPEAFARAAVRRMGEGWGSRSDYGKIKEAICKEYGKDSGICKSAKGV